MTNLLTVENLHTQFDTYDGTVRAVDGVSLTVDRGEIVGVVGESGCGKSVTARSIVGLQSPGKIVDGLIEIDGTEVTTATNRELQRLRGETVSMVFQDPTETLNPVFDVGDQIVESLKVHEDGTEQRLLDYLDAPLFSSRSDRQAKRERAIELMEQVGIASPGDRVDAYPHELSGGMRQRACIAIALASDPDLLIADEPTTALDTTTQAQILDKLRQLNADRGLGMLLITHDLGVVAEICDRVVVLYAGEVMETGPTDRILTDPRHPYTRALLDCLTQRSEPQTRLPAIEGQVPELTDKPAGCPFAPRCEHATDRCRRGTVPTVDLDAGTVTCGEPIVHRSTGRTDDGTVRSDRETMAADGVGVADSDRSGRHAKPALATTSPQESPPHTAASQKPLVSLDGVSKRYLLSDSLVDRVLGEPERLDALVDIDLDIQSGETFGLVGESGSGKSTLAGLVTGLESPTSGEIRFSGEPVGSAVDRSDERLAKIGVVFQDPRSSLNPRRTVAQAIAEPLVTQGWDTDRRRRRVAELLALVGLPETYATSYPHELSGGQIQRVAIARAIALDPQLLVLDEPVSALDASVKARVLNLLLELQDELDLTYLVISHDLDVITHIADRVAVLYLGQLMEVGLAAQVFDRPAHPYTRALVEAIPSIDPGETTELSLSGEIPSPVDPPLGCVFHTRCPMAEDACRTDEPAVATVDGARSRCHFADDVANTPDAGDSSDTNRSNDSSGTNDELPETDNHQ
jgi:peptide/nickel transport system ATP-binding protein